jgi:hypothetical protein
MGKTVKTHCVPRIGNQLIADAGNDPLIVTDLLIERIDAVVKIELGADQILVVRESGSSPSKQIKIGTVDRVIIRGNVSVIGTGYLCLGLPNSGIADTSESKDLEQKSSGHFHSPRHQYVKLRRLCHARPNRKVP